MVAYGMGFVTEKNEKMKKYKKAFEYIRSDAYRYMGRCDALKNALETREFAPACEFAQLVEYENGCAAKKIYEEMMRL